ncbi:MAG: extracellular solute-binding protein [Alphaproteobacteria bacterium]
MLSVKKRLKLLPLLLVITSITLTINSQLVQAESTVAVKAALTKSWAVDEFGKPLYDAKMSHWPYVNPDAPTGGAVTLGAYGSFDSLNPYILKGDNPVGLGLVSETLMVGSADELTAAYGLIAANVEYPADISYAIFHLRPEAKYHDGVAIVAEDVVFSYDTIKKFGKPFLQAFLAEVEKVEALDAHRLRVDFKTKNTMKPLINAATILGPLPRHYWKNRDISKTTLEPVLGSGPYKIAAIDPGHSITYQRVKDYWGKDLPMNKGLNNIETIRYDYYLDETVMFEALKAGKIDYRQENKAQRWTTGYDAIAEIKNGKMVKKVFADATPQGVQGLFFNTRKPDLADVRVREALSLLYDFVYIQRGLLNGQYKRSLSYFPNSDYGTNGAVVSPQEKAVLEPFAKELDNRAITEAFSLPQTDGSGNIRVQQRAATELLKKAGWNLKDGKMQNAEGRVLAVELMLDSPSMVRVCEPFVQNLKKIGINATMRMVDTAQSTERLDNRDFDLTVLRSSFFPPPGPELRSFFGSKSADIKGSGNWAGVKNKAVDELIEKIIASTNPDEIKLYSRALDRALLWGFYLIPQWYNPETWVVYWNKFAYPERLPVYSNGFPATWWVKQ